MSFIQLYRAFRAALADAADIIAIWKIPIAALCALGIASVFLSNAGAMRAAVLLLDLVAEIGLTMIVVAEATRLRLRTFRMTPGAIAGLAVVSFGYILAEVVIYLPFLLLRHLFPGALNAHVFTIAAQVTESLLLTRLLFIFFLSLTSDEESFSTSIAWTSGPAYLPSLVILAFYREFPLLANLVRHPLTELTTPILADTAVRLSSFLLTGLTILIAYPWIVRWMSYAQATHALRAPALQRT